MSLSSPLSPGSEPLRLKPRPLASRGVIMNSRSMRLTCRVSERNSDPTSGMLPSTGTWFRVLRKVSRTSPPTNRLSPSVTTAWVLILDRSTTGMLSTEEFACVPSSILTRSFILFTWALSWKMWGVTLSVVPTGTLKRSTSLSPATRTKNSVVAARTASTSESVITCGFEITFAAPFCSSARMRERNLAGSPRLKDKTPPWPVPSRDPPGTSD